VHIITIIILLLSRSIITLVIKKIIVVGNVYDIIMQIVTSIHRNINVSLHNMSEIKHNIIMINNDLLKPRRYPLSIDNHIDY